MNLEDEAAFEAYADNMPDHWRLPLQDAWMNALKYERNRQSQQDPDPQDE